MKNFYKELVDGMDVRSAAFRVGLISFHDEIGENDGVSDLNLTLHSHHTILKVWPWNPNILFTSDINVLQYDVERERHPMVRKMPTIIYDVNMKKIAEDA